MNKFITNSFVKVKVNAKKVKPHLRDKPYKIIRCIGEIVPFHYLVEDDDKKQYVFKGDELQII